MVGNVTTSLSEPKMERKTALTCSWRQQLTTVCGGRLVMTKQRSSDEDTAVTLFRRNPDDKIRSIESREDTRCSEGSYLAWVKHTVGVTGWHRPRREIGNRGYLDKGKLDRGKLDKEYLDRGTSGGCFKYGKSHNRRYTALGWSPFVINP